MLTPDPVTMPDMNETYGERVKRLREAKDLSIAEAARGIGVSRTAWFYVESGQSNQFTGENAIKAAELLGVTTEELVTGRAAGRRGGRAIGAKDAYAPASDLPVSVHRAEDSAGRADIHRIPKLNVAGGQGRGALLPSVEYQSSVIEVSDEWLRANLPGIRISNLRAITGLGPSMHPTFSDGDILFTDISVTRLVHDRIFALFDRETGELFIKRVTRYPLEECWSITSDNPLHNNPPMADKVPLEKIAAKLGVGGCVVGKWAFTKL